MANDKTRAQECCFVWPQIKQPLKACWLHEAPAGLKFQQEM